MFNLLKQVFFLLGESKKRVFFIAVLFLLSSIMDILSLSLIGPYIALLLDLEVSEKFGFILKYLSDIHVLKNFNVLVILSFFILFIFLVKIFFVILVNKLVIIFGLQQMVSLRLRLTKCYQNLPYVESQNYNQSSCILNLTSIVMEFSQILMALLRVLGDGMIGIFVIIFLATQSLATLLILMFLLFVVIIIYYFYYKNKLFNYGKRINDANDGLIKGIQESIRGLKEIRILGKESYFYEKIKNNSSQYIKFSEKIQLIQFMPRYILEFTLVFFIISISLVALLNNSDFKYLIPIMGSFAVASLRLFPSINSLLSGMLLIKSRKNSVDRLYKDINNFKDINWIKKIENTQWQNNKSYEIKILKNIELRNVSFKYPSSEFYVFRSVNLEILSKEAIAIVGDSGSGKSTLVDIIIGLMDPSEGSVLYNKIEINKNINYIINNVAYIPQESFLINSTIFENIALGEEKNNVEEKEIIRSLEKANLLTTINKLPLGLKTNIGENGVKFSGGERQRIALARSFYHNRDILIFDEATSALDNETEEAIFREIKKLKGSKTIILISHNKKNLDFCDKIFEIKNNTVVKK